jgi:hypothetical protein
MLSSRRCGCFCFSKRRRPLNLLFSLCEAKLVARHGIPRYGLRLPNYRCEFNKAVYPTVNVGDGEVRFEQDSPPLGKIGVIGSFPTTEIAASPESTGLASAALVPPTVAHAGR